MESLCDTITTNTAGLKRSSGCITNFLFGDKDNAIQYAWAPSENDTTLILSTLALSSLFAKN